MWRCWCRSWFSRQRPRKDRLAVPRGSPLERHLCMAPSDYPGKKPAFLILGPPGSGKGTQGRILGSVPRFFHFACGDVFRSIDTRTALGKQFVDYSSRGELVPDELTIELWKTAHRHLRSGNQTDPRFLSGRSPHRDRCHPATGQSARRHDKAHHQPAGFRGDGRLVCLTKTFPT